MKEDMVFGSTTAVWLTLGRTKLWTWSFLSSTLTTLHSNEPLFVRSYKIVCEVDRPQTRSAVTRFVFTSSGGWKSLDEAKITSQTLVDFE